MEICGKTVVSSSELLGATLILRTCWDIVKGRVSFGWLDFPIRYPSDESHLIRLSWRLLSKSLPKAAGG